MLAWWGKKFLSHCNNCFQSTHFKIDFSHVLFIIRGRSLPSSWPFPLFLSSIHGISPAFLPCNYRLSREKKMCVEWSCLTVSNFPFQFLGLWSILKHIHARKQGCLQVIRYLKDKRVHANCKRSKMCQGSKGDTCLLKS